jgi:hypothetical protein
MRDNTSRNQANGSTAQRLHVAMKFINTAAVLPPLSLPKNVQLPRPIATSRLARSVAPLSISRSPSNPYRDPDTPETWRAGRTYPWDWEPEARHSTLQSN